MSNVPIVITSLLFSGNLLAVYKRVIVTTCWETPNRQGHAKMGTEHNEGFMCGGKLRTEDQVLGPDRFHTN